MTGRKNGEGEAGKVKKRKKELKSESLS